MQHCLLEITFISNTNTCDSTTENTYFKGKSRNLFKKKTYVGLSMVGLLTYRIAIKAK